MTAERFKILFDAYLTDNISASELAELILAFSDEKNEYILDEILEKEYAKPQNSNISELNHDEVNIYEKIRILQNKEKNILYSSDQTKVVKTYWIKWAVAASILICISVIPYFYLHNTKKQVPHIVKQTIKNNDATPGLNKATLTLSDGTKIVLSDSVKGVLFNHSNVTITKTSSGKILYKTENNQNDTVLHYNTLSTARHEQFQVVLPDGSVVWLNSASSLEYPLAFNGKERLVKLNGQAYFEIFHNTKQPFIVQSKAQKVIVTGTHFDVNAYDEENETRTTLLEGKVSVTTLSGKTKNLHINEQSLNKNGDLSIKKIDPEAVQAWKNGYFMFDDEDLESIMHQLARWYDVQIVFQDNKLRHEIFAGSITKFTNISEVLKMLNKAGNVHFKIENKKIYITK